MKTIRLDHSKLLGFHAVRKSAVPLRKPSKSAASKSTAKIGAKVGGKFGVKGR